MKLRGAGWLFGTAVTLTALGTVAACDDADTGSIGINFGDSGVNLADGAATDGAANGGDGGANPDGGDRDANLPAQCNDGKLDLGETCDPLGSCPTECAPDGCKIRSLENGGTCAAVCTVVAEISQCQNSDGCCPDGCSIANDNDCGAVCGNGVKEAGEKCDGADCPTVCPPIGCTTRTLANPNTCQAECVDANAPVTACTSGDNCCPAGGACAGTDSDCAAGACGNGTVDAPGETCDTGITTGGAGTCPTRCAPSGCNLFQLTNAGTCQAACTAAGTITQCVNGDGCCAPGCNNTNDSDCAPKCGNNVTETGESCDGNCPTSCPQRACQLYRLDGSAATCDAKCTAAGTQTQCVNSDGCCPAGCTSATDNDCTAEPPKCGNGKLDLGETCDDSDPKNPCPTCNTRITCNGTTGSAASCDLRCDQPILDCRPKGTDSCCPLENKELGCGFKSDADCKGDSWKVASYLDGKPFEIPAGACVTFGISNIEAGAAYDMTTCSKEAIAEGDVSIRSVSSNARPPIVYGANDDCKDEKLALPWRAGFTCNNRKGLPTMACVSEGPGGFVARNAADIMVVICSDKGASVPFNVFYNSTQTPKLGAPSIDK